MTQNSTWIAEYSASKQDFRIQYLSKTLEDNLTCGLQGNLKDYQPIGAFFTKETAQIFIEGFKMRISSSNARPITLPAESQSLTYTKALALIKREVAAQPRGFIKKMCHQSKLTYHTVIGLLNDTLPFKASDMVMDILVALGYHVISTLVAESVGKGPKNYKKETIYLIRKETPLTYIL